MKFRFRFFSILLSLFIVISSFFQCSITVYAKIVGDTLKEKLQDFNEKFAVAMSFFTSSGIAIANGDFKSFLEGYEAFNALDIDGDHGIFSSIDDETETVIYSDEFLTVMKQALIEYAEETNGFELIATTNINDLSASDFNSGYIYHSFRNLVYEAGVLAAVGGGLSGNVCNQSLSFSFFLPFDKEYIKSSSSSGAVSLVKASNYNSPYWEKVWFYDSLSWGWLNYTVYECKVYYNTDEGHTAYKVVTSLDECPLKTSGYKADFQDVGYSYVGWNPEAIFSKNYDGYFLYSTDGRKLKVFNSLNALKNYTVSQRGVYFGSGFYDTPGEIKVSFDDLEKYMDKDYDKLFDELKDLINKESDGNEDSLTEEDLEKLVDRLLEGMNGGGSGGNEPGTGDSTGILEGIASALSGYFESVLAYLDSILASIQDLIFVEQVKPDDEHQDLSDMINDVWKDPQNGSQAVADSLSASFSDMASALMAKFPFCIPNDFYSLLNVFSGMPESRAASFSSEGNGIQAYAGTAAAPRFELPLVVESLGIEEMVVIDMVDFQLLSTVLRIFISLIFAVGLMKLTAVVVQLINNAWGGIS